MKLLSKELNTDKCGLLFFLFCRLLSTISEQLNVYAIPLIIFEFTKKASKSGEAYFFEWLPAIIALPFLGIIIVDHFKERHVYICGDLLRFLTCLSGVIIISLDSNLTYVVLIIISSILAILNSQNFVALETTIGKNFEESEIPHLQTCVQGIESTAEVISPVIAGVLVVFIPKILFLLITSLIFLATGFGVLGIPNREINTQELVISDRKFISIIKDVKKGFSIIFSNFSLMLLVGLTFIANLILGTITALNPAIVVGTLGGTSQQYAVVAFYGGITQIIVLVLLAVIIRHVSLKYLGIISGIFMASSGYVIGIAKNFGIYILGYSLIVAGISIFNIFLRSERIKIIPKESFGKAMGSIVFFNRLSLPLAGFIVAKGTLILSSQQVILILGGVTSFTIVYYSYLYFLCKPNNLIAERGIVNEHESMCD